MADNETPLGTTSVADSVASTPPQPTLNTMASMNDPIPPVQETVLPPPPNVSSSEISPGGKSSSKVLPLLLVILLLLGGVGAFMLYSQPKAEPILVPDEVPEVKPVTLFLDVTSPSAEITAVNGEVLVAGVTLPNTPVLIYSDVDETSTDSDTTGKFEETVVVGESGGVIKVIAFGENGDEESATVEVGESKAVTTTGSNVLGKTDAPGQVKKAETLEEGSRGQNPGAGSNKSENGSSPKNTGSGGLKPSANPTPDAQTKKKVTDFLAVKTPGPKLAKVGTSKLKTAQLEVGTGSALLKGLNLKKLVATTATPGATLKRHALGGVVTSVADGVLTVAHQIQRDRTFLVYYNASTVVTGKGLIGATGASIELGMRIAAVGEPVGDGILAKRIHVIPGNATGVFEKNPISSPSGTTKPTPSASVSATPVVTKTPTVAPTVTVNATPTEGLTGNETP